MKHLLLTLVVTATCSQVVFSRCQRRMARPNPIMGALQNLFLPGAGERAMKGMLPAPVAQVPRELEMPNVRVVQPKCTCQQEMIYKGLELCPQALSNIPLVPNMPVPVAAPVVPVPAPSIPAAPLPMPVAALQPEILYPLPLLQEKCSCCSCASPAPLVSPFLPAASPVSAWAPPTSNLLPPVIPNQSRTHFLRKVPIPPPTL